MNRHVNAIAGRLSLRPPQRQSLEILEWKYVLIPHDVIAENMTPAGLVGQFSMS